tara:strand:+ start:706 stop:2685 length:1980 start_codon:yes stop_codon:yes gene_type:complete
MKNEIKKVLELIKNNNFSDAKIICDNIKNNLEQNFEFINIHGYVLFQLNDYQEAIKLWKKAISINPDYVFALNNLGNASLKLNKLDEAVKFFKKALNLKPDYFEAVLGISDVYLKMHNYADALIYLNKSLNFKPNFLPVIKSKLHLLQLMDKKDDALKFLEEIIHKIPNNAYLYHEKALILSQLGRETEAINSYKSTYLIDPSYPFVLGNIVFDKLMNCEWHKIENDFEEILSKIGENKEVADPLTVSYIFDSPLLQNKSAKIFINSKKTKQYNEYLFSNLKKNEKINIGYYSADFRNHPVGHLIARIIELHDKSKFNVHGFYFGKKQKKDDGYYIRFKKAFNKFHDISSKKSEEIVNLSKNLKIDIAIDLMGHTGGFENRLEIFLNKCAPIQINFLGYPGTSGTNKIDYIIADKTVIEEEDKKFYSEKVIFLPNSYQPSEKNRVLSETKFTKKELNLPEDKFIFCCFNSNQKILKTTFNLWVEILKRIPESVLWLLSKNNNFIKNLKDEFQKKNIESERIVFGELMPVEKHLVRIKFADLFLDTFPYNAHTTCSDSIWAGVPVLTKKGKSFHSRVASSLLKTSGLEELITYTDKEYIDKAVKIVNDIKYLKNLKERLNKSRDTNPLFNSELFTRKLEEAYEIVLKKYFENQNSDDVYL